MSGVRRHLRFANVVSLLALFVALGGGAYAIKIAKKNSVTSKSIKNGQVKTADIGDGEVGSADVADGSLTTGDLSGLVDATAGTSRQEPLLTCTQTTTSYTGCIDDQVQLEAPGRVFATVDGSADSGGGGVPVGVNTCRMTVDGVPFTTNYVIAANFSPGEAFSFASVTPVLAAGNHSVEMLCKGNGTAPGPRIFAPTLTLLELGPG